jgi:hypothetical protein
MQISSKSLAIINIKLILGLFMFILIISGCNLKAKSDNSANTEQKNQYLAQLALNNFLNFLYQRQYNQVTNYYGGSYEQIEKLNPGVNKEEKAILWQNFCQKNKGVCLIPKIYNSNQEDNNTYNFSVQYYNEDNSLYSTPGCPCKGGGQDSFSFTVVKNGIQYLVMDLPPIANLE